APVRLLRPRPPAGSGADRLPQEGGHGPGVPLPVLPVRPAEAGPAPPRQAGGGGPARRGLSAVKSSGKDTLPGTFFSPLSPGADPVLPAPPRRRAKGAEGALFLRYVFLPSAGGTLYNVVMI